VGFLDSLFGRTKPAKPDLDQLFALPSAAITLQVATGFRATGAGSVCFRAMEGGEFARVQAEVQALLDADQGPKVEVTRDRYGYTWLLVRQDPGDLAALVTDLHAVNSSLENAGFGPSLLVSLVAFAEIAGAETAGPETASAEAGSPPGGRRLGLVYLYKRGTFYPFAPQSGEHRDNPLELQVRGLLANDLRLEDDLARWFPVWGAPGLAA
jgi:hypothetical protein